MINPQLQQYIITELERGLPVESVRETLVSAGWNRYEVEEAINVMWPQIVALQKKTRKFPFKLAVIAVLMFAVLGSGGYVVYAQFIDTPERNFAKMFDALKTVKTYEYSGDVSMTFNNAKLPSLTSESNPIASLLIPDSADAEETVAGTVNFTFSGKNDATEIAKQRGELSMLFKITASQQSEGFGFGGNFEVGLEAKYPGDDLYVKLTKFPDLGLGSMDELKDKWIYYDKSKYKDLVSSYNLTEGESASASATYEEQSKKVVEIFKKYKVLTFAKGKDNKVIDGKNTKHYTYVVNKEEFKKFFAEVSNEVYKVQDKESVKKTGEELVKLLDSAKGEIWIGADDSLPYRYVTNVVLTDAEKKDQNLTLDLVMNFKSFNKPVMIDIPKDAVPLEELFQDIYPSSFETSSRSSFTNTQALDIHTLQTALEMYYTDEEKYPARLDELKTQDYLETIPLDPIAKRQYQYSVFDDNSGYSLCAISADDVPQCVSSPRQEL